jgi:amino acid transporter
LEEEHGTPEPVVGDNFAGWGIREDIENIGDEPVDFESLAGAQSALSELPATAICGNDITSSCLYVSALCTLQAGVYAPLALAIVAIVLYLFRKVYSEVGTALPLNGGAYNVLLNTASKPLASLAACLTILSYIATAVLSANEAMHYAHHLWHGLPVIAATVALLGLFAFLNILGITESAKVATGIFIFHISTLSLLVLASAIAVVGNPSVFLQNWHTPIPHGHGLLLAVFFGFSAAMLGISGFESSANFIEEQEPGVFPKTLRNMWLAVGFFNPVISLLSLALLPLAFIAANQQAMLAEMGAVSALPFLSHVVSVDAVLVLSGAVLTSFVGVTGLIRRMSLDRCLPQRLLTENRWRGTNHWIILSFFVLCVSILLATGGDVAALAGVYTLSFLGVMALFAVGNMLLKIKRARLPRAERASWPAVLAAFSATLLGLVGNVVMSPEYVSIFFGYFTATALVVALMLFRTTLLRGLLFSLRAMASASPRQVNRIINFCNKQLAIYESLEVIYFTRGDHIANLNSAALYVLGNEQTHRLLVAHVYQNKECIPPGLEEQIKIVDKLYPSLRIDFITIKGTFGPDLIERLSRRLQVPKNYMFIGTPGDRFPHDLGALGGVRLVL